MDLQKLTDNLREFADEAHDLFAKHEVAASRLVNLSNSYGRLSILNLNQDELMRQALRSIEFGLYRSAHVMAWAGFMDFYEEILCSDGLKALSAARPKWRTSSLEDLRESISEFQLIESGKDVKLLSKNDVKALHGLLNKRNECAHPSKFHPDLNEALGYFSELLQRIANLRGKSPVSP